MKRDRRYLQTAPPREPPPIAGRVPPNDVEAEEAVLSAVLSDREALDRVLEFLAPEHFYSEQHQLIFTACRALALIGKPIDYVTVNSYLRDRELVQRIGGVGTLARLVDATPAVAHVVTHAKTVKEKWRLRRVIGVCQKYAAEGYGDVGETQTFIDSAEQAIYDIARTPESTTMKSAREVLFSAFTKIDQAAKGGSGIIGIPTGFVDFDKRTGGLHRGDVVIVAGRPGMAKTSFSLNVAVNVASPYTVDVPDESGFSSTRVDMPGHAVAIFQLEMPDDQVGLRLICAEARVDVGRARNGHLTDQDWADLTKAAEHLSELPIWIDDKASMSVLEMRAKIRRLQAEIARTGSITSQIGGRSFTVKCQGIGLVAVDYLQLLKRAGESSREEEVSENSRALKELAKDLKVPVMALAQLNRGCETRPGKNKRPMLADLRESGAVEQDADTVVFIYRDEYYHPKTDLRGIAELIIGKQRNGPTGTVKVRFVKQYTRFENLAPGEFHDDEEDAAQ